MDRKIVEMPAAKAAVKVIARSLRVGKQRIKGLRELARKHGYLAAEGYEAALNPVAERFAGHYGFYFECLLPLEAELRQERLAVQNRVEGAERLRAGRVKWIVDNLPDKAVADQVGAEIKTQLRALEELRGRLAQIDARLAELRADEVRAEEISKYLGGFMATFDKLDTGQRRLLMQALVKEVVVKSKHQCKAEFKLRVPPSKPATNGSEKGLSSEKKGLFSRLIPRKPDYSRVPVILLGQGGSGGRIRTYDPSVTRPPGFHRGLDYLITHEGCRALPAANLAEVRALALVSAPSPNRLEAWLRIPVAAWKPR